MSPRTGGIRLPATAVAAALLFLTLASASVCRAADPLVRYRVIPAEFAAAEPTRITPDPSMELAAPDIVPPAPSSPPQPSSTAGDGSQWQGSSDWSTRSWSPDGPMEVRPIGQINTDIRLAHTPQMRDLQQYEQLQAYRDSPASEQTGFLRDPHPTAVRVVDVPYGPPLNFCYRPLYFEEGNLERYGYSWGGLQPAVSAAHFYGNFAVLPYKMAVHRPGFCTYHQHHARPGAAAPPERPVLPLRAGGALLQTAAVVGLIALIP